MPIAFGLLRAPEETPADADGPPEKEVLNALRRAAREHPAEADYLFMLGEATLRYGRPAEAVHWLREAVRHDPNNAPSHSALGRALRAAGHPPDAVEALREAVRLDSAHLEARCELGLALLDAGDANQASRILEALVAKAPGQAAFHSNLGAALWHDGRRDEALSSFQKAVSLQPASADLRRNLGLALAARGDRSGAVASFRHAVRLRPRTPGHLLDLADALFDEGRRAEAAAAYEEALALDAACLHGRPRSQEARHQLMLSDIRDEVEAGEGRPLSRALPLFLVRAGAALARAAGRRKGLDLALATAALVVGGFATVAVLRPWVRHYRLHDEAVRIARLPADDERVREQLHHAIRRLGLEAWLDGQLCEVRSEKALRRIACAYAVPIELLPGLPHTLHFRLELEEPFLVEKDPVLI
jgi:tetratricopeptide (TPR) repeat protein